MREKEAHDPKEQANCLLNIILLLFLLGHWTGSLVFIYDFTAHRNYMINVDMCRSILCGQIQPNVSKFTGCHIVIQQVNYPQHAVTASIELLWVERGNMVSWLNQSSDWSLTELTYSTTCKSWRYLLRRSGGNHQGRYKHLLMFMGQRIQADIDWIETLKRLYLQLCTFYFHK